MAYANVLWAVQMVLQIGLGLVFLFSRHIRLGQLLPAPGRGEPRAGGGRRGEERTGRAGSEGTPAPGERA